MNAFVIFRTETDRVLLYVRPAERYSVEWFELGQRALRHVEYVEIPAGDDDAPQLIGG